MPDLASFIIAAIIFIIIGYLIGKIITTHTLNKEWEDKIPEQRADAINRSRASLGGKFSENLSPYFPDFPFHPTEMRWLGSPVDYIVFKGMDNDKIEELVFLEIKSGKSVLTSREKQIKKLIEEGKVSWKLYNLPNQLIEIKK
ncbi:MAG TPA: Holliday junction resolvase-like protein [Candidatus Nanoarchaeia archaeon]|nr:Holliday junction resolvase-like protein [Candidatus Nanoarchaeia archaeon]